jgi:hypothetical protein
VTAGCHSVRRLFAECPDYQRLRLARERGGRRWHGALEGVGIFSRVTQLLLEISFCFPRDAIKQNA